MRRFASCTCVPATFEHDRGSEDGEQLSSDRLGLSTRHLDEFADPLGMSQQAAAALLIVDFTDELARPRIGQLEQNESFQHVPLAFERHQADFRDARGKISQQGEGIERDPSRASLGQRKRYDVGIVVR